MTGRLKPKVIFQARAKHGKSLYRATLTHLCGKDRCDFNDCPRLEIEAAPVGKAMRTLYSAVRPDPERLRVIGKLFDSAASAAEAYGVKEGEDT